MIRINPDKEDISNFSSERFVHLEMGSLNALTQIKDCIHKMNWLLFILWNKIFWRELSNKFSMKKPEKKGIQKDNSLCVSFFCESSINIGVISWKGFSWQKP